jgi:hypothetical protein
MKTKTPSESLVEIIRSFSYKLNVGNYESRDFFCSYRAQCLPSEIEQTALTLHEFCEAQVQKSVDHYRAVQAHRAEQRRNQ